MSDSIDITDLVEKTRSTFVEWGVAYIYGEEIAIPGLEWVAIPVIKDIDQEIIRLILTSMSKSIVMQGFFMNTAIRKATQADDFVKAVKDVSDLPEGTSDEIYNQAELKKMQAFRDFVSITA